MKSFLFFSIGWIGGAIVVSVDGFTNQLIVLGIVVLVYSAAFVAVRLTTERRRTARE
jgi:hypothetical protein